MFTRRLVTRVSSASSTSAAAARPFTTTPWPQRSPALSDIHPDRAPLFEEKQREFRQNLAETQRQKKQKESQSSAQSQSATSAKSHSSTPPFSFSSSSPSTPSPSATVQYLDAAGLGSLSLPAGEAQRLKEDPSKRRSSKGISGFIYGTEEGREMDREIERSFSQVLARGKYVHSIVFHEVKPDKVDEYVELVGNWYPRMANMPENKVHLVGSWRTEVGDCDTFGGLQSFNYYEEIHADRAL